MARPQVEIIPASLPAFSAEELQARQAALGVSPREYEVLQEIAQGKSNQEIAAALHISENTVKTHVSNLLSKLEARRRTEAVSRARELQILA